MKARWLLSILVVAALPARIFPASSASVTLATMSIPGTPDFVRVAKDIIDVKIAMDPSSASGAGLFEDAVRVPSFSAAAIAALNKRLEADLAALRAMPWRQWPVDNQVDFRWMYACAKEAQREIMVERTFTHRPADWIEPVANNFIDLLTYAPERKDLRQKIIAMLPAMVEEMRTVISTPTVRDVTTAEGVADGVIKMLRAEEPSRERDASVSAFEDYVKEIKDRKGLPEFSVIGADNYAWRLKHVMLLPWTPDELLAMAQSELKQVDAEMAGLKPQLPGPPKATAQQEALAKSLTRDKLLSLYDQVVQEDRKAVEDARLITIPTGVGPIHARETPDAMVPLTGDGGSMNPPPTFGNSNVGYWNVEHFHADWPIEKRESIVVTAQNHHLTDLGPYAVHEGIPGHHLQLSIARLLSDPLRSIIPDSVQDEGWALYAEEAFWRAGGLGPSAQAHYNTLDSWRYRIRRVIYDVNIETGRWTLQQAADFKDNAPPGKGKVDEDILRSVNWPGQLICYFSGKTQILELRRAYRNKLGPQFTDREFHDSLLSVGSIPYVFAGAKLLGRPLPDPD